jgi:hypothetical protein
MSRATLVWNVFKDAARTATNAIVSDVIDMKDASILAIQLVWSGTAAGTATLLVSNNNIDWSTFTLTFPTIATGAGNGAVQVLGLGYNFARIRYVNASGTGVLSAFVSTKQY